MEENLVILIAEDDEGHFILLKNKLRRAGLQHRIVHFSDGQKVLDFLLPAPDPTDPHHYERYILLLDIRMPKLDGIEVLARLREDPRFTGLSVAMITSSEDPANIRCCHDLACDAYIVKPINEDSLQIIRQMCSGPLIESNLASSELQTSPEPRPVT